MQFKLLTFLQPITTNFLLLNTLHFIHVLDEMVLFLIKKAERKPIKIWYGIRFGIRFGIRNLVYLSFTSGLFGIRSTLISGYTLSLIWTSN